MSRAIVAVPVGAVANRSGGGVRMSRAIVAVPVGAVANRSGGSA